MTTLSDFHGISQSVLESVKSIITIKEEEEYSPAQHLSHNLLTSRGYQKQASYNNGGEHLHEYGHDSGKKAL